MLKIKGLEKNSLVDYPPYVVSTIFLGNCNFRCSYCHNPDLILKFDASPDIPETEILEFLKQKREWLDGVCITGGEPTLYSELPQFMEKLKLLGLKVKLDTNGTNPAMLKEIIDKKLVDYIAMDIKTDFAHYNDVTNVKTDINSIKESINILKLEKVDCCFRSTVLPRFHTKNTIKRIGEIIKGAKRFIFQDFRNSMQVLDPSFKDERNFTEKELEELKQVMKEYVVEVEQN